MNFQQHYDRSLWSDFFRRHFLPDDFAPARQEIETDLAFRYIGKEISCLGTSPSLNLDVYEMKHTSENDPRIGISRDAFRFLDSRQAKNGLILFISDTSPNYRLSLITRELVPEGTRVTTRYTNPKRFSYLLGPGIKEHTISQYLFQKGQVRDEADLKSRFSIEIVNKDFYNGIAELFSHLVGGVRGSGSNRREFTQLLQFPEKQDQKAIREFAVRLIGRIVFCWFLKKKKSTNNIPLIPEKLLSVQAVQANPDYYHTLLEPLFFEVMNKQPHERKKYISDNPLFSNIPFLNGGLFDYSVHSDCYSTYDDDEGSSYYKHSLKIPDKWFMDIFELFELYNFTIDENTPVDIDLSVDPEMLGRIFENLLAEINPETEETARKNSGSYYTPRPIVEYMVDASLTQYLLSSLSLSTPKERSDEELKQNHQNLYGQDSVLSPVLSPKLQSLLDYTQEGNPLSTAESKIVIAALNNLKVIDPACGSGAFPMGILQKMLLIRQKIDPRQETWIEEQLKSITDPYIRKTFKEKMHNENWDYRFKLSSIHNSVFGVDKESMAVEISKLRIFLTLIVDETVDDSQENRGINPLPNLPFKFVVADSLNDLKIERLDNAMVSKGEDFQSDLFIGDWLEGHIKALEEVRDLYFYATTIEEKEQIKKDFYNAQKKIGNYILDNQIANPSLTKIANWNPFSDEATDWFNPKWMFGVKNGFDIVIGNPPYIQLQNNNGKLANMYQECGYETFCRTGDIYSLFYERGVQLLKENGILTFITSNKWMRAKYGERTRNYFSKHEPLILIDLGSNIFEAATVDTNILIIRKGQTDRHHLQALDISKEKQKENFSQHSGWVSISNLSKDSWTISSPIAQRIKEKIERIGKPLKDWDINIYYGIKTGLNEAFVINSATRETILNNCRTEKERTQTADIIKPLLRGRDIKRYKANWAGLWLIFIPWHFPLHEDSSIQGASVKAENEFQAQYPTVYQHLYKFKEKLSKRNKAETGIRYEWYALQRCAASYYPEFEKEKIVYPVITKHMPFSIDTSASLINDKCFFLISSSFSIKYLITVFNSKIGSFWIRNNCPELSSGLEMRKASFHNIPIVNLSECDQQPFIDLAETIISGKEQGNDTTHLEAQIDRMVYDLYNLTPEEINEIERM